MGKPATSETINGFSQAHYKSQEEENGFGSEGEAVRQIEGLLGSEEIRQEVNLNNLWL
jgi:hypothetical protein